jgi:exosortase A-associated hydrolase 2
VEAFFLPATQGQRLCILYAPTPGVALRGSVIYIHPFAEEMNRCRRMASLQTRALAQAGFATLQLDLMGCGDSSGDFGDATWAIWLDDIELARQCLTQRYDAPLWLWGARAGCLLAAQSAARSIHATAGLLLWMPVVSGRQHLQQFLRLRMMAEVVRGNQANPSAGTAPLLQQLERGLSVEVAGYTIGPELAAGLSGAGLDDVGHTKKVLCLEVAHPGDARPAAVSPALTQQLARWNAAGVCATVAVVPGEPFWQVPEAPGCTELLHSTTDALIAAGGPGGAWVKHE